MFRPASRSPLVLARLLVACFAGTFLVAAPARAATWAEVGEAGQLVGTAQSTVGVGSLAQITGTFSDEKDVDMYCIHVPDKTVFYAGILCSIINDPNIWLFDSSGIGLSHQDLCQFGDSDVNGLYMPGPGTYYIAVACEGWQAYGASGAIWLTSVFSATQRPPDGPGAPGPLTLWTGAAIVPTSFAYTINLTGAEFCNAPTPLRAGSWGRVKILYR